VATALALPLAPVKDPMSGFFALPREAYERARRRVRPLGYKIGLELMVKCGCGRVVEEPIRFEDRHAGESKLTARQQIEYLVHVLRLYLYRFPSVFVAVVCLTVGLLALLIWRFA
jgi:dolichol-phosphate mannosyltransferase